MEKFIEKYGSPFKILGLNYKTQNSEEDIKKAFFKLSLKYHPDKNNNLTVKEYIIIQNAYKYAKKILEFKKKEQDNDLQIKKSIIEKTEEYNLKKNNFKIKNFSVENELKFGEDRLGKIEQKNTNEICKKIIVDRLDIKNDKEFNKIFDFYSKKNNQIVKYKKLEGYQDDNIYNYTKIDERGNYVDEFYDLNLIGKYKKMFWNEIPTDDDIKKIKLKK